MTISGIPQIPRSARWLALGLAATLVAPSAIAGKPGSGGGTTSYTAPIAYSGRAEVLHTDLTLLAGALPPLLLDLSDTGALDATGGFKHVSLLTIDQPVSTLLTLKAEVASALTSGLGTESYSWASVASARVGLQSNPLLPAELSVRADVIQAASSAKCVSGSAATSGSATLVNLSITALGVPVTVPVDPAPNTTIAVPGVATIVLNEQIVDAAAGSITVNALHIRFDPALAAVAAGDIVISDAHSDISCSANPPPPQCPVTDFVTFGGYIDGPNGGRANFGGVGGYKPNGLTGHLNYLDHGSGGPHVSGASVSSYALSSSTARALVYGCDASTGGCNVYVDDQGEPGSSDSFSLGYTGYNAGGLLKGGNIQLHKPQGCPVATSTKGRK